MCVACAMQVNISLHLLHPHVTWQVNAAPIEQLMSSRRGTLPMEVCIFYLGFAASAPAPL